MYKKELKIYIGADHAAVALKEQIKKFLDKKELKYEDVGSFDSNSKDDYPDYAFKMAEKVAKDKDSKGVLLCGTGTGMVIAANKVKGIRAAVIYDNYSAKMARNDNDTNVACLRARQFSSAAAIKAIQTWLRTTFSEHSRHKRRIRKIASYEKKR